MPLSAFPSMLTPRPPDLYNQCSVLFSASTFVLAFARDAIGANRGPSYFLAPPTVRTRPTWYLPLLPAVMRSLVGSLRANNPALSTLRAFMSTTKDLDADGVHFNAISGRDYVLHLLDYSRYKSICFTIFSRLISKRNLPSTFLAIVYFPLLYRVVVRAKAPRRSLFNY